LAIESDLRREVEQVFRTAWTERDGLVVPEPEDLNLGNDGVNLDATVLYADMSGSTKLVDAQTPTFAAEVYKSYLICAARIIKNENGAITAYDGDRVMGVFIGKRKNTNAAIAALKLNWAVSKIVNPGISGMYGSDKYSMKHVIGVDTSKLLASRIGVRNYNDLVWVGRSANYAAKLSSLNDDYPIYITGAVFDRLHEDARFGGNPRQLMWEKRFWTAMNNMIVYRSSWIHSP
jgi:class 3 adenylate cyclase